MDVDSLIRMDPKELPTKKPFSNLFPRREDVCKRITESMRKDGFDVSHPIHAWREGNCAIDGHQRLACAIKAGIDVYVYFHSYKDEDEALDYAIRSQRDRRNLTDAEFAALVKVLDTRRKSGRPKRKSASSQANSGKSAAATAEKIGVSKDKVEKARAIQDYPDLVAAVESGEMSLNKAAKEARDRKRDSKPSSGRKARISKNGSTGKPKQTNVDFSLFVPSLKFADEEAFIRDRLQRWPEQYRGDFAISLMELAKKLFKEMKITQKGVEIDLKIS